ncbi:hypothetical protein GCM10011390_18870 [Aureimonas endophytica]|uniref:Uncharacterized protein n=1 Tax=Aureimonas endophytica TaxID=2027858 RepID=A0A916ZJ08_9HYPH|nr:hypothetical protein [Aureimonas endophytica]GGE00277.1 hypothetical protein GCM10011390_18870 [Aureimonas endophytica]
MTYNPTRFCHSLEGGIQALAMAAFNAAQQERQIDRSAPQALDLMTRALRRERSISKALAGELEWALARIAELEAAQITRPRRSANPR